jgi:hypothetical protein
LRIGAEFERRLVTAHEQRAINGRYHGSDHAELLSFTPEIGLSAGLVIAQADAPIFFCHGWSRIC